MTLNNFLLNEETYDFDKSLKKVVDEIYDFVKKSTLGILPMRSKSIKNLIEKEGGSKIKGFSTEYYNGEVILKVKKSFSKKKWGGVFSRAIYRGQHKRLEFTFPVRFNLKKTWEKEQDYVEQIIKHELTHLLDSYRHSIDVENRTVGVPSVMSFRNNPVELNAFMSDVKVAIKKEPRYDEIKNRKELSDFFLKSSKKYHNQYFFWAVSDMKISGVGYKKIIDRLGEEKLLPKSFTSER